MIQSYQPILKDVEVQNHQNIASIGSGRLEKSRRRIMATSQPNRHWQTRSSGVRGHTALLLAAVLILNGCHGISIPSYRSDACGCHGSSPYPQAQENQIPSADQDSQQCCSQSVEDAGYGQPCDYKPVFPLPACLARYRDRESLPEGPDRIMFHPLPTRPMFRPRPAAWQSQDHSDRGVPYGSIPEGHGWRQDAESIWPLPNLEPGKKSAISGAERPTVAPAEPTPTKVTDSGQTKELGLSESSPPEQLPSPTSTR